MQHVLRERRGVGMSLGGGGKVLDITCHNEGIVVVEAWCRLAGWQVAGGRWQEKRGGGQLAPPEDYRRQ